jgi:hypothetical protein
MMSPYHVTPYNHWSWKRVISQTKSQNIAFIRIIGGETDSKE